MENQFNGRYFSFNVLKYTKIAWPTESLNNYEDDAVMLDLITFEEIDNCVFSGKVLFLYKNLNDEPIYVQCIKRKINTDNEPVFTTLYGVETAYEQIYYNDITQNKTRAVNDDVFWKQCTEDEADFILRRESSHIKIFFGKGGTYLIPTKNQEKPIQKEYNVNNPIVVSLNDSNREHVSGDSQLTPLFCLWDFCNNWISYRKFIPINKLAFLKNGRYNFKCYNQNNDEISGSVNIMNTDQDLNTNFQEVINTGDIVNITSTPRAKEWESTDTRLKEIDVQIEQLKKNLQNWTDVFIPKPYSSGGICISSELQNIYDYYDIDLDRLSNIPLRSYRLDYERITKPDDSKIKLNNNLILNFNSENFCIAELTTDDKQITVYAEKKDDYFEIQFRQKSTDTLITTLKCYTTGLVKLYRPNDIEPDYEYSTNVTFENDVLTIKDCYIDITYWIKENPSIELDYQIDMLHFEERIAFNKSGEYYGENWEDHFNNLYVRCTDLKDGSYIFYFNGELNDYQNTKFELSTTFYSESPTSEGFHTCTFEGTYILVNQDYNIPTMQLRQGVVSWDIIIDFPTAIEIQNNVQTYNVLTSENDIQSYDETSFKVNTYCNNCDITTEKSRKNVVYDVTFNILDRLDWNFVINDKVKYNFHWDLNQLAAGADQESDLFTVSGFVYINDIYITNDFIKIKRISQVSSGNFDFQIQLPVYGAVSSIFPIKKEIYLSVEETYTPIVAMSPVNTGFNLSLVDPDSDVVSIDGTEIKAKSPGTVGIIIKSDDGSQITTSITVHVIELQAAKDIRNVLYILSQCVDYKISQLNNNKQNVQPGRYYKYVKQLNENIDPENDWVGEITFIPDDPYQFVKDDKLTIYINYLDKQDSYDVINYYNYKNEYVQCPNVKNYYLGSKKHNLKTVMEQGLDFIFKAEYKSVYFVKGKQKTTTGNVLTPFIKGINNETAQQYNLKFFDDSVTFEHIAGVCVQDASGDNTEIMTKIYKSDNKTLFTSTDDTHRELDKERDAAISEQEASNLGTNYVFPLIPTFLYKTGEDNLAKSSVQINDQTVSILKKSSEFNSDLKTSLGTIRNQKIYPGSLWEKSIDTWLGEYLGLLSNLYVFSENNQSNTTVPDNYAYYESYSTTFTKDILVTISPRSLDNYNKYITIRDVNYVEWLQELNKYRKNSNDNNVNLILNGIIKNFPMSFKFDYKIPTINIDNSHTNYTAINTIYGDTIYSTVSDIDEDKLYVLDGNSEPVPVEDYPYIPKCKNNFKIVDGTIQYSGEIPSTLADITDLVVNNTLTKDGLTFKNSGTYSIAVTQYRKGWGKKQDRYLTELPSHNAFIK